MTPKLVSTRFPGWEVHAQFRLKSLTKIVLLRLMEGEVGIASPLYAADTTQLRNSSRTARQSTPTRKVRALGTPPTFDHA